MSKLPCGEVTLFPEDSIPSASYIGYTAVNTSGRTQAIM